ncbi:anti-repressor SinI family protein [Litchfieldia alkalitelluris]|nr:anti-repressor SinI family protein [Litchfieldia alkalitelluris]
MASNGVFKANDLDEEWVDLILYALEIGMSVEEIREFFTSGNKAVTYI